VLVHAEGTQENRIRGGERLFQIVRELWVTIRTGLAGKTLQGAHVSLPFSGSWSSGCDRTRRLATRVSTPAPGAWLPGRRIQVVP